MNIEVRERKCGRDYITRVKNIGSYEEAVKIVKRFSNRFPNRAFRLIMRGENNV